MPARDRGSRELPLITEKAPWLLLAFQFSGHVLVQVFVASIGTYCSFSGWLLIHFGVAFVEGLRNQILQVVAMSLRHLLFHRVVSRGRRSLLRLLRECPLGCRLVLL